MADVSYLLGDDDIRTVLQNSGELGKILDFVLLIASEERSGGWAKLLCTAPPPVLSFRVFSLVSLCHGGVPEFCIFPPSARQSVPSAVHLLLSLTHTCNTLTHIS